MIKYPLLLRQLQLENHDLGVCVIGCAAELAFLKQAESEAATVPVPIAPVTPVVIASSAPPASPRPETVETSDARHQSKIISRKNNKTPVIITADCVTDQQAAKAQSASFPPSLSLTLILTED